jgi:hypothetical protein
MPIPHGAPFTSAFRTLASLRNGGTVTGERQFAATRKRVARAARL